MKKKLTTVQFCDAPEKRERLDAVFEKYRGSKGALMPVMQEAQGIYGYLPIEIQRRISENMDIPLEEIYGVASFYAQFTLNPKGQYSVSVCMGTACYVKGAGALLEKIKGDLKLDAGETSSDGKYSLEATRCVGACGLAPIILINEDVYGRVKVEEIPGILAKYK